MRSQLRHIPFAQAYAKVLSPWQRAALRDASVILLDTTLEDIRCTHRGESIDFTWSALWLPSRYQPKYTPAFLQSWFITLMVVGWKLAQPKRYELSCVAEELAAWAIIGQAKIQLEVWYDDPFLREEMRLPHNIDTGEGAFADLEEALFEDFDALFLFDDEYDGIDESKVGQRIHLTPLAFNHWFEGWPGHPAVHPTTIAYSLGTTYQVFQDEHEHHVVAIATDTLIDDCFTCLLSRRPSIPPSLTRSLPAHLPGVADIDPTSFFIAMLTVVWKWAQPHTLPLSSRLEQIAAHVLVTLAREIAAPATPAVVSAWDLFARATLGESAVLSFFSTTPPSTLAPWQWHEKFPAPHRKSLPNVHPYG